MSFLVRHNTITCLSWPKTEFTLYIYYESMDYYNSKQYFPKKTNKPPLSILLSDLYHDCSTNYCYIKSPPTSYLFLVLHSNQDCVRPGRYTYNIHACIIILSAKWVCMYALWLTTIRNKSNSSFDTRYAHPITYLIILIIIFITLRFNFLEVKSSVKIFVLKHSNKQTMD